MARSCASMFTSSATDMGTFHAPTYAQRYSANLASAAGRRRTKAHAQSLLSILSTSRFQATWQSIGVTFAYIYINKKHDYKIFDNEGDIGAACLRCLMGCSDSF
jgi:hypothetical protein